MYMLGIVRNIDTVKRIVYIITPEPLETLKTVNVLMKGRLEIMDALYKVNDFTALKHRIRKYTEGPFSGATCRPFFMQKLCRLLLEGGAASQYSVFIGRSAD